MKLKPDISVKDKHFVVAWSPEDSKKIERYTTLLRTLYGDPKYVDTYNLLADVMIDLIQKRHDDHHNAFCYLGHDWLKVEPLNSPCFEPDMVTFQGLNKLLKIYAGLTTGIFKWVGRGTSAGTPTPYSTQLVVETGTRIDSTVTGFHEVKGSSLRIFVTYATTVATATMQQLGVFDASTTGMMLAIHDFGGNGYTHTINVDSFSLGSVIDFVPFGDV